MDFEFTDEQKLIQKQIRGVCDEFGDEYWREKDANNEFAWGFYERLGEDGWFGITVPEKYGGQGYGIEEAAIMQQEVTHSGAGNAGTSITGSQTFATKPLVEYGDEEHKKRYLEDIVSGEAMACIGVTDPNAGVDTSRIGRIAERDGDEYVVNGESTWTSKAQHADVIMLLVRTSERDDANPLDGLTLLFTEFDKDMTGVDVQKIRKAGRGASDSNQVWYDNFRVPVRDRIGEEGDGFKYLLSFVNSERLLVAAGAIGIGYAAIDKAREYANNRVVFGNEIGSYQAIQHPIADSWSKLQLAELMVKKGAWKYDNGLSCGPEANTAKLRASEAACEATERAMRVHGGMGYSKEMDVERYWKESLIPILAPIPNEMVRNYISHKVLDLPRSY